MIYFCAGHIHNFLGSLLYIGVYHFFIPVAKNRQNFSDYEGVTVHTGSQERGDEDITNRVF